MEDGASAWSSLGSSMALPSTIREEVSQMQIELRDMKLQLAKDIMELREVLSSVAVELTGVMDKHKSLLTRIEGLEVRAQGIGYPSSKDEFNAFAYVQLDELEDFNEDTEEVLEASEENVVEEEESDDSPELPEEVLGDEDVAAIFYEVVKRTIETDGGILNNNLHHKYPDGYENTKVVKSLVKKAIESDDSISAHKIDKFRTFYYRTGEDPEELYASVYGKS